MKKIYKYKIQATEELETVVKMPTDAKILDVQLQDGDFTLWAIVNPDNPTEERVFCIYGTGWEFSLIDYTHLKTIQDGEYVWHVFESLI